MARKLKTQTAEELAAARVTLAWASPIPAPAKQEQIEALPLFCGVPYFDDETTPELPLFVGIEKQECNS